MYVFSIDFFGPLGNSSEVEAPNGVPIHLGRRIEMRVKLVFQGFDPQFLIHLGSKRKGKIDLSKMPTHIIISSSWFKYNANIYSIIHSRLVNK